MNAYVVSLATFAALNVMLALGLNLISGFCGQISLGHAAFYGIGAYGAALAAVNGFPFPAALAVGVLAAAVAGVVTGIASLRVREDFLAIVTMGVGFLFLGVVRKAPWFGAEMGISKIPPAPFDKTGLALVAILCAIALVLVSLHIRRSWMGESFRAVADDEDVARTIGIDVTGYKLVAFLIGTAAAGLAGGLYAYLTQLVVPDTFGFVQSVTILAMVVIGGIGSTWGVVFGAVLLTLMPELFRFINDYKLLVYGALLLLVMRFSPGGIAGWFARFTHKTART